MALSHDERYEDLKTRVEDLEDRYRSISRRIGAHDVGMNELGRDFESYGRALSDLKKRVEMGFEAANRSLGELRRDFDGSFAQNTAYQLQQDTKADARFARVLENFDRVWVNFQITDDRFKALNISLSEVEARQNAQFSAMRVEISTTQGDISTLKTSQATMQGDISTMQTDISTLKTSQATMQGDITEMKGTLALILERLPAPPGK